MLHGDRISGQGFVTDRNRPCGGNKAANLGHQFVSRQDGRATSSARRKDAKKLEKSSLRKTQRPRGGEINPTEQAVARCFLNRHGVQAEQNQGIESRGLPLTGGYLWQR